MSEFTYQKNFLFLGGHQLKKTPCNNIDACLPRLNIYIFVGLVDERDIGARISGLNVLHSFEISYHVNIDACLFCHLFVSR